MMKKALLVFCVLVSFFFMYDISVSSAEDSLAKDLESTFEQITKTTLSTSGGDKDRRDKNIRLLKQRLQDIVEARNSEANFTVCATAATTTNFDTVYRIDKIYLGCQFGQTYKGDDYIRQRGPVLQYQHSRGGLPEPLYVRKF